MADEAPVNTSVSQASMAEVEWTRRMVVFFIFVTFWMFLGGIMYIVAKKGWELPPNASDLYSQIFIVVSNSVWMATGFYLGSSYGSALKDMVRTTKPPEPPKV